MKTAEDLFLERYRKLNTAQQEAVDTVYGPVMVIAGPGTGKTEVLSLRIAALLRSEAQVAPHEILCLTYTDEAANSMRKRLVSIIGPEAHKVSICTFHAFCNGIIQQNAEYFPQRSLSVVSDLEKADLMRGMIDDLPEKHALRRYGSSPYFDIPRLSSLFEYMKREAVTPEVIEAGAAAYMADLPNRDEYRYKRKSGPNNAGDLKQAKVDEEQRRMDELCAGARLYDDYTTRLDTIGRYDYADMILWVLDAFKKHPALLMRCQERYQFLLVDEFQDTNGAQLAVVNALTDQGHDEAPNVFVVGDDDQSIYEFQGARIRNIMEFYERYKSSVKIVVLPHNYRSSQAVLDRASATIRHNLERLINRLGHLGLTKDIVASHPRFKDGADTIAPQVLEFANPVQEEAWVVHEIEKLQEQGVNLGDVAVLYAQHKQAAGIIRQLERKGIPFCAKQPANVLDLPLVRTVLTVLRYLQAERDKAFSGEALLFDWMHAPVFGIDPTDIATLALYARSEASKGERLSPPYRALLDNPLLLQTLDLRAPDALMRMGNLVNRWMQQQTVMPLTLLLETILHESGLIARVLEGPEPVWDMQALRTFFDFVKETCTAAPRTGIAEMLAVFDRMDEEKIALKYEKVFQNERGVNFYTAHGSKGNEFEYVFLVGCNKQFWEKKSSRAGFKLPDTLTNTTDEAPQSNDEEVARRLFYVALTRAKKHLTVSYATEGNNASKWDNSLFVDEISAPEERIRPDFGSGRLLEHLGWAMQPVPPVQIRLGQRQWVEKCLQNMALSPSTLSNFLRCPVSFYYECILRVPQQGAPHFAFGSAVHYALETAFLEMRRRGGWPDKETILAAFERAMYSEREAMLPQEFRRRLEHGRNLLSDYYDERLTTLYRDVEIEYKVSRVMLDGVVPVTGRIDKIEKYPDGVVVVDYKTGKAANAAKKINPPSEDEPLGGDYWRQMVFYKILLEGQPERRWDVKYGFFDLLEKGDRGHYEPKTVPMFEQDVAIVKGQIRDAWGRIQNGDFDTGCGKEECSWCGFARRHELIRPVEDTIILR